MYTRPCLERGCDLLMVRGRSSAHVHAEKSMVRDMRYFAQNILTSHVPDLVNSYEIAPNIAFRDSQSRACARNLLQKLDDAINHSRDADLAGFYEIQAARFTPGNANWSLPATLDNGSQDPRAFASSDVSVPAALLAKLKLASIDTSTIRYTLPLLLTQFFLALLHESMR
jgi:hypothetical protein